MFIYTNIRLSLLYKSVLVLLNERHVGIMLRLLNLRIWYINPRKEAVKEQCKWILIHVQLLSLWNLTTCLLIVLYVVEIYPFYSITEVVLVDVGVSRKVEGNRNCFCLLNTQVLKVGLIVKFLLYFVKNKAKCSFDPQHHVVTLP